jgi:hypothetical protein
VGTFSISCLPAFPDQLPPSHLIHRTVSILYSDQSEILKSGEQAETHFSVAQMNWTIWTNHTKYARAAY